MPFHIGLMYSPWSLLSEGLRSLILSASRTFLCLQVVLDPIWVAEDQSILWPVAVTWSDMADFLSPLRTDASCSFILVSRGRPVSPTYSSPHSHVTEYTSPLRFEDGNGSFRWHKVLRKVGLDRLMTLMSYLARAWASF